MRRQEHFPRMRPRAIESFKLSCQHELSCPKSPCPECIPSSQLQKLLQKSGYFAEQAVCTVDSRLPTPRSLGLGARSIRVWFGLAKSKPRLLWAIGGLGRVGLAALSRSSLVAPCRVLCTHSVLRRA